MNVPDIPDIEYARSGDVAIAYQVIGEGPIDLVFARGFAGDLLSTWDQPLLARHVLGLAGFSRVLMLDKRGTGLSDRVREVPTLETRMDDLRSVMDAAGSERAVLWCAQETSRLAVLFGHTLSGPWVWCSSTPPHEDCGQRITHGRRAKRNGGAGWQLSVKVGDVATSSRSCCSIWHRAGRTTKTSKRGS